MALNNTSLINHYLRRVLPIIKTKHSWEDLWQEGFLGLCKATDNYKPELGYSFSTYALKCIKNKIYRYIARDNFFLSAGHHTAEKVISLRKLLQQYPERTIYDKEFICDKLQINPDTYDGLLKLALAKPLSISEFPTVVDAYTAISDCSDKANEQFNKRILRKLFKVLTPFQSKVLALRYGLEDGSTYNAKQIANKLNIPEYKVYNTTKSAKKKLKEYKDAKYIDLYI